MSATSIPVDLFNPGQVFACLGLLEAADILLGDAEGGFNWGDETDVRFHSGRRAMQILSKPYSSSWQWRE